MLYTPHPYFKVGEGVEDGQEAGEKEDAGPAGPAGEKSTHRAGMIGRFSGSERRSPRTFTLTPLTPDP